PPVSPDLAAVFTASGSSAISRHAWLSVMRQTPGGVATHGQRIGYVRVSTVAETLEQQQAALDGPLMLGDTSPAPASTSSGYQSSWATAPSPDLGHGRAGLWLCDCLTCMFAAGGAVCGALSG